MTLYCGIDLHSNYNVPVVIDDDDKVLFSKRLPNHLPTVISALSSLFTALFTGSIKKGGEIKISPPFFDTSYLDQNTQL